MKFSLGLILRHHGADPDATDASGNTALHVAARRGNIEACDMLLQSGAKVVYIWWCSTL